VGTLETGKSQVIDAFDGKIVLRKPINEKEKHGNGLVKRSRPDWTGKSKAKAWDWNIPER
jgi:hypothetical protein